VGCGFHLLVVGNPDKFVVLIFVERVAPQLLWGKPGGEQGSGVRALHEKHRHESDLPCGAVGSEE